MQRMVGIAIVAVFACALFLVPNVYAQDDININPNSVSCASGTTPPDEAWNRTFGGNSSDLASSVQQTIDGGYIVAGYTYSYGAGEGDAWLLKTDSDGNEEWNKTFGGVNWDEARSVQRTADGGYILAGSTCSYGAGGFDLWPIKVKREQETQTIILNTVSNAFPMFSNAEYVNFTIGDDITIVTLDSNASFDGVYNLSNLTGTNISAAGSSAELYYAPISYQNGTYGQKWKSAPYFNDTENKLYLLSGSGIISKLNLTIKENTTDKTIPKVVGIGDFIGNFVFV